MRQIKSLSCFLLFFGVLCGLSMPATAVQRGKQYRPSEVAVGASQGQRSKAKYQQAVSHKKKQSRQRAEDIDHLHDMSADVFADMVTNIQSGRKR